MTILIGMDEAGYGPNLGPLVVAATAWEVGEEDAGDRGQGPRRAARAATDATAVSFAPSAKANLRQHDLYRRLRGTVCRKPSERQIAISDSKELYKPGLGLRQLERGVHAVLRAMKSSHGCWSQMVGGCAADPKGHHARLCWHDGFDCPLPVDAGADELARLGERFARGCESAVVRPLAIRARLVFPAEFNELCAYYGSKGAALSHVTIGLLREMIDATQFAATIRESGLEGRDDVEFGTAGQASSGTPSVFALCDKHGGRNFYAAILQHHFSEHWIEPLCEGATESRYGWGAPESRTEVAFRVGGEGFLPTALASMTAKYLRELSMRAFNEFWCARVPGLRPTAGYPTDAPRFKREISAAQRDLGIDDHVLWRNR